MPRRMCGDSRIIGGSYWEFGTQQTMQLVSAIPLIRPDMNLMVLDPPVEIDVERMGLQTVGVKMVNVGGVNHILDWVGETHYPNVADFVEEAKAVGLSRRMPSTLPFGSLTEESRLLLVHRKAILTEGRRSIPLLCPQFERTRRQHSDSETCSRFWYSDIVGRVEHVAHSNTVIRELPCGQSYTGYEALSTAQHRTGIFASVPLDRIAVVRDRRGTLHEATERRISVTGVRYVLTEE